MTRHYAPEEYDAKGQLRLPFLYLADSVVTGAHLVAAGDGGGASRQQGNDLLALFYPDRQSFWLRLRLSIPALLLTGYRQCWPHVWQRWRYVLSLSLLLSLLWQGAALLSGALTDSPLPLFDLLALYWLATYLSTTA